MKVYESIITLITKVTIAKESWDILKREFGQRGSSPHGTTVPMDNDEVVKKSVEAKKHEEIMIEEVCINN